MKFIFVVLLCVMLITPALATLSTSQLDVEGTSGIGIHTSTKSSTVSANSGVFNSQSSSRKVLTVGVSSFKALETSNQQYKNTFDSSMSGEFSDAALVYDKYSMEDSKDVGVTWYSELTDNATPSYQYVEGEGLQMGSNGGAYKSAGVLNEANLTTSFLTEGNAGGSTYKTYSTTTAGFTPGSADINFEKTERTYDGQFDKNGTGYELGVNFIWKDHSVPFEVVNNTTPLINSTVEVNITNTT